MSIVFQELGNFRLLLFPERPNFIELQIGVLLDWFLLLEYAIVGHLVHLEPDVRLAWSLLFEELAFQ